jgi:hypothetical protein
MVNLQFWFLKNALLNPKRCWLAILGVRRILCLITQHNLFAYFWENEMQTKQCWMLDILFVLRQTMGRINLLTLLVNSMLEI